MKIDLLCDEMMKIDLLFNEIMQIGLCLWKGDVTKISHMKCDAWMIILKQQNDTNDVRLPIVA